MLGVRILPHKAIQCGIVAVTIDCEQGLPAAETVEDIPTTTVPSRYMRHTAPPQDFHLVQRMAGNQTTVISITRPPAGASQSITTYRERGRLVVSRLSAPLLILYQHVVNCLK